MERLPKVVMEATEVVAARFVTKLLVAAVEKSEMVEASWVPVWLVRSR